MAGISVGGHDGRRALNQELPLIPFIDFLLCLVSFLLITAVWSQASRLNVDANAPGRPRELQSQQERTLHVEMRGEEKFQLIWKQGNTVINSIDVPRKNAATALDDVAYPDLAATISQEWSREGSHRADSDLKRDRAVLHTDNQTRFEEVVAVMDAIYAPTRELRLGSAVELVPAFQLSFAVD